MDPMDRRQICKQCHQYQLGGGNPLDWTCQSCGEHSNEGEGWIFVFGFFACLVGVEEAPDLLFFFEALALTLS